MDAAFMDGSFSDRSPELTQIYLRYLTLSPFEEK